MLLELLGTILTHFLHIEFRKFSLLLVCRKIGFAVCNLHLQNLEWLAVRFAQSCLPHSVFEKTGAAVKLWWVILEIILLKFSQNCGLDLDNYMVLCSSNSLWFSSLSSHFFCTLFTVYCNKLFDTVLYKMELSNILIHVLVNFAMSWPAIPWSFTVEIADMIWIRQQPSPVFL